MRTYEAMKFLIKKHLKFAKSKIHITGDLWSSGNHKSVLGVIAHYINEHEKLTHQVLAVRELQGSHAGENQAQAIAAVICEYEIEKELGFYVGDNDSKNDTMCVALSKCMFSSF
jgi:hypothetical protein